MRISDWSSDVCSSDLHRGQRADPRLAGEARYLCPSRPPGCRSPGLAANAPASARRGAGETDPRRQPQSGQGPGNAVAGAVDRSEEHTSELQSLMRISYAVFCLKKKKTNTRTYST